MQMEGFLEEMLNSLDLLVVSTRLPCSWQLPLGDVEIEIIDKLISVPYVEMTLRLMERSGVSVEHNDSWDRFLVKGSQKYKKGLCRRGCIECQLLPCRCGSHWWNRQR